MRVNHAVVVVIRACVNVLKRRQKKSQQESQAGLQRNARTHSLPVYRYLHRSASVGFSRHLSWQLAQAVVMVSAASRILS